MAINKVVYGGDTIIDLTNSTVTAETLMAGATAYDRHGNLITGTASGGGLVIVDTQDSHGGIIRTITAEDVVKPQSNKTVTPAATQQIIVPDTGYTALEQVTVEPIPNQYIIPSGTKSITANGTGIDVTQYASVDVNVPTGPSKNIQAYLGYDTASSTSYTATDVSLTVAKTGTYKVSWMGYRNTTSGTNGSQLYINGSAYGSAQTSFVNSYGQSVTLNNVSLTAGQTLVVRARARSASYVMGVGNLIIEEI